jgi:hypothetical protein
MTLSSKSKNISQHKKKLQQQHLDYISICLTLGIILLLSIISKQTRLHIFQIIKNPVVISIILVICLGVGYYHFLSSMLILIMLVFLFLQDSYLFCLDKKSSGIKEGFISKERMVELDEVDKSEGLKVTDTKIKELFKPGYFGKRLAESREKNKAAYESTLAKNKAILALEKKKRRMKNKVKSRSAKEEIEMAEDFEDLEETFADNMDETENGKKSGKAILRRKFDPTNEEDSNLLLTMESCSEIKDRIKYNYENKEYLKRYIRDKLEEIIELLQLIEGE